MTCVGHAYDSLRHLTVTLKTVLMIQSAASFVQTHRRLRSESVRVYHGVWDVICIWNVLHAMLIACETISNGPWCPIEIACILPDRSLLPHHLRFLFAVRSRRHCFSHRPLHRVAHSATVHLHERKRTIHFIIPTFNHIVSWHLTIMASSISGETARLSAIKCLLRLWLA